MSRSAFDELKLDLEAIPALCEDRILNTTIHYHDPERTITIKDLNDDIWISRREYRERSTADHIAASLTINLKFIKARLQALDEFISLEPFASHEQLLKLVRSMWHVQAKSIKSQYEADAKAEVDVMHKLCWAITTWWKEVCRVIGENGWHTSADGWRLEHIGTGQHIYFKFSDKQKQRKTTTSVGGGKGVNK